MVPRRHLEGGPDARLGAPGRLLLLVIGLLVVLAVGTAWVLFRLYGPDLARTQLEHALSAAFGRPARVGAVTFRPWVVTLRVSDVRVPGDPPADGGARVTLAHADVGIRLESLWRRRLVLSIALTGLDVMTLSTGDGGAGLAAFSFPSTFSLGSVEARVGLVRLARGHIQHRDPGSKWAYEVSGIEAEAWPASPALWLSARADSLRIETPTGEERVEQLRIEGSVGPGEIQLEPSRLRWQGHEIRLSGRFLQPVPGAEVHATLRAELPLAATGSRVGLAGSLSGLATVDAVLEGLLDAPRVEARVTVPELGAGPVRARDVRLAGSFIDGTLRVSELRADLPGGAVRGALTVSPAAADGVRTVELTLDGLRLPRALAVLGPGSVRAKARLVHGRIELGPASARWANARLDVAGLLGRGYPLALIEAQVTASRVGLRITQARGLFGGGTVSATGEAALTNGELGSYRVGLTVRHVAASPMEGLSTLWDGELEVTGRGARGQVGGELRLVRGNYTRELAPASKGPSPAAGPTETGPALPVRVLVKLDDNLIVRNRTARLRIGGTLSVEGTTAAPAVLGAIESREGIVAFRNRRFTVVSATARFLDPRRVDPFLNAVATARIREYDVTVRVSGRVDSLDVNLRSTPPLSQEDLLALVAFGATRAELERSPAGVLAFEATSTIVRDLLGLDTLEARVGWPAWLDGSRWEHRLPISRRPAS